MGLNATVSCTGQYNWDCVEAANGTISMTGTNSAQFVKNYGFFVSLSAYNSKAVVVCTSCHNQHLMNMVSVTNGAKSGLPTGNYATMFFIRAPYNPANSTAGTNQTAQFCRQCHGGEVQRVERRRRDPDHVLNLLPYQGRGKFSPLTLRLPARDHEVPVLSLRPAFHGVCFSFSPARPIPCANKLHRRLNGPHAGGE